MTPELAFRFTVNYLATAILEDGKLFTGFCLLILSCNSTASPRLWRGDFAGFLLVAHEPSRKTSGNPSLTDSTEGYISASQVLLLIKGPRFSRPGAERLQGETSQIEAPKL